MKNIESNIIIEVIAYSPYGKSQCEVFAVTNDKRHIPIDKHLTTTDKNEAIKELSEFLITFEHNNIVYEINGNEDQIKLIDDYLCNQQNLPKDINISDALQLAKLV